jgi:DNA-directed RNA polymerase subunit beta'
MFPERESLASHDFDSIRLKLASPEQIMKWSYGEVTKPETINYRTQKPEKDGLFDERIFGPTKDWECYCGKYKRIRYRGIICDKCGVEVTRSVVRRERFGHIKLASPVSHIWFLRGVPSKIGLVLGLSVQDLEKVIYFASFIIVQVDEAKKSILLEQVAQEYKSKRKSIEAEAQRLLAETQRRLKGSEYEAEHKSLETIKAEKLQKLDQAYETARHELRELEMYQVISESQYQDLSLKYGQVFEAGIGAEAVRRLMEKIDIDKEIKKLEGETAEAIPAKQRKMVRRLKLLKSLKAQKIKPEWMVLDILPVIPADLRPMVQLDGGRFATSDLNDLYRRVINRNNRLKRLLELNAPEVICRNEKRMLQEAVDALIDNGARHGKTVAASTGQRRMLKSIADILKGKQGRFRQNLLGKRIDYSGRSVIVVGPTLQLHQCGLPKRMALELFKPFIISKLIKRELVHNVRSANRFIEAGHAEVWDILEEIIKDSHVLLNRAPTLHRLGIQAFQPLLIEGKAIQVHPLVCPAFNADFDGDQMAVHVPLTEEAKWEASHLMLSSGNLLKPATGEPVATPAQDIVLGCYYMTNQAPLKPGTKPKAFTNLAEAVMAYQLRHITLQETIIVRREGGERLETCVGRLLFNEVLPTDLQFCNKTVDKKTLKNLVAESLLKFGIPKTANLLDRLKEIGFSYLTLSGLSWGMGDLPDLPEREAIYAKAETEVDEVYDQYQQGLLTDEERHTKVIEIWAQVKERVTELSRKALTPRGAVFSMIESGSRGSWGQITQMMGMKGLVTNPAGDTIELPVKGNFKEGFDVLEYFISTHGTRKGLTDTALRTANAGYLTRRLVDVSHDIVVVEKDCGDKEGFAITAAECEERGDTLGSRAVGRFLVHDLKDPKTGEVLVKKNEYISLTDAKTIDKLELPELRLRSLLSCKTRRGVCQRCYGADLGLSILVEIGTAVGIIAAQSIGEPGTQLTMRTFHTGGVASAEDITQGLPRVEEVFEARPVKRPGLLSPLDGKVEIISQGRQRTIKLTANQEVEERWPLSKHPGAKVLVKKGAKLKPDEPILKTDEAVINTVHGGLVKQVEPELVIVGFGDVAQELAVPVGLSLWVKDGDLVTRGQPLTDGSLDLHELYQLRGKEAVQRYVLKEIQYIYSSQGQKLNDKHIEIIVRQMFSRLYVTDPGDTELLPGEVVTSAQVEEANDTVVGTDGRPVQSEQLLMGITKASLSTDSFLSAASFQETARVLIDAAVTGKIDKLRGLKENVIIGRLIPAGTGRGPASDRLGEFMAKFEIKRQANLVAEQAAASAMQLELQAQQAADNLAAAAAADQVIPEA